ncbi:MAG TPA: YciI family protein [Ferruginibacter sp.]|mgnify:CR=1 FL=1|nr:YciI family protein [Ferruginibacter sp.]
MKYIFIVLLLCTGIVTQAQKPGVKYDKALADSLGADDYGMKKYLFVILKTGKTIIEDKQLRDSLFKGHMDNIGRLAKEGKLIVAGPIGKNEMNYRGIFIFNVASREELDKLLKTDPTIEKGIFDVDVFDWYGSAALPTYLPNHDKIQKTGF